MSLRFFIKHKAYFVISLSAVFAYLPVSSFLLFLKNDIVAIEFPFQYIIAESIQNGTIPVWFNSWAAGFPLQSILTWGIYSTPQILFGTLFGSSVYTLHIQFIVFIILSGIGMYRLLKNHFFKDENLCLILACCFMLSGFTVASSQWLLYITCLSFTPWLINASLKLIKRPSLITTVNFSVLYFLFFTNVHVYLSIVTTYLLIFWVIVFIVHKYLIEKNAVIRRTQVIKFIGLACVLTLLLCIFPIYYTIEVMSYLDRSEPIKNLIFFQSNYLHPKGLLSFLLPLATLNQNFQNTSPVVLNTYIGLLPLLLTPIALRITRQTRNTISFILLSLSILMLLASFGHLTPVRNWLNILPGFKHFRHPGVLRVFFVLFFILFLAQALRDLTWNDLFNSIRLRKILFYFLLIITSLLLLAIFTSLPISFPKLSLYSFIKNLRSEQSVFLNAITQLFIVSLILFNIKSTKFISTVFLLDVVINTLVCIPFYTVSSYSLKEAQQIILPTKAFPPQIIAPSETPSSLVDYKGNPWQNVNVFRKQVSTNLSSMGPLVLRETEKTIYDDSHKGKKVLYLENNNGTIKILKQLPNEIIASINLHSPETVILQQSNFPGWKVFLNNKQLDYKRNDTGFVSINLPATSGELKFIFSKPGVWLSALVCHFIVIIFFSIQLLSQFKINRTH